MRTVVLLISSFVIGVLFTVFDLDGETANKYDMFLFYDMSLSIENYFYFLGEHIKAILIYAAVVNAIYQSRESKIYTSEILLLLVFESFDMIDYMLSYNSKWFTVRGVDFDYNILHGILVGYVLVTSIIKHNRWKYLRRN